MNATISIAAKALIAELGHRVNVFNFILLLALVKNQYLNFIKFEFILNQIIKGKSSLGKICFQSLAIFRTCQSLIAALSNPLFNTPI
jgi:hypothetical protein